MKLPITFLSIAIFYLATAVVGQQQPEAPAISTQTKADEFPTTPDGKNAWFDTNLYLSRGDEVKL